MGYVIAAAALVVICGLAIGLLVTRPPRGALAANRPRFTRRGPG